MCWCSQALFAALQACREPKTKTPTNLIQTNISNKNRLSFDYAYLPRLFIWVGFEAAMNFETQSYDLRFRIVCFTCMRKYVLNIDVSVGDCIE